MIKMKHTFSITILLLCIAYSIAVLPPQVRLNRLPYFRPPPATVHPIRLQRNALDIKGLRDFKDYKLHGQRYLLPSLQNSLKHTSSEYSTHNVYRVGDEAAERLAIKHNEAYFERLYPSSRNIH